MVLLLETPIQLVPDGTLLFHLACIIAMVAILNATLLKPINRILEERDRRTRGRLTEAEAAGVSAQDRWRQYERKLRDARAEGYALMERERTELSRERDQRISEVRAEVSRWVADEKSRINAEGERAKAELAANAQSTAREISEHILNRRIG